MSNRKLVVIVGSSGVGKSSLSRALQEELLPDQWLHFSVDSVFYCLPRSIVERVDQQNDRSSVDSRAIVEGAYACARALLDQGHKMVFDVVILSDAGAERLMQVFAGYDPLLVELSCAWPEIAKRTVARADRTLAEAEHGYRNAEGRLAAHLVLDSTDTSAEELARRLAVTLRGEA